MQLLPFFRKRYETEIGQTEILKRINELIVKPDWKMKFGKNLNNGVLEGRITNTSFIVARGKHGLTYGMATFLPILKGELFDDEKKGEVVLQVVIRPSMNVIALLSFFYFLGILMLIFALSKLDIMTLIFFIVFFTISHSILMSNYNKSKDVYIEFIEHSILKSSNHKLLN